MGCAVSLTDVWLNVRRPADMCIGAASQFLFMPLVVFGLVHAFNVPSQEAIAFMIIGTSPGGTMSNFFTFWADGDLSLRYIYLSLRCPFSFTNGLDVLPSNRCH